MGVDVGVGVGVGEEVENDTVREIRSLRGKRNMKQEEVEEEEEEVICLLNCFKIKRHNVCYLAWLKRLVRYK